MPRPAPPLPEAAAENPGTLATALLRLPNPPAALPVRANSESRPERDAGGGVRRGRRHLNGRETIGRKHRRPGLWPQVTPAFRPIRLSRPGSFAGGFIAAVVERGLWSLGKGLLLLWWGGVMVVGRFPGSLWGRVSAGHLRDYVFRLLADKIYPGFEGQ